MSDEIDQTVKNLVKAVDQHISTLPEEARTEAFMDAMFMMFDFIYRGLGDRVYLAPAAWAYLHATQMGEDGYSVDFGKWREAYQQMANKDIYTMLPEGRA